MSRKGQLWRGELAQHIESYLSGQEQAEELLDWALDHPFFDDQSELDDEEQRVLAEGLGRILQMSEAEPLPTRTTRADLAATVRRLWGTPADESSFIGIQHDRDRAIIFEGDEHVRAELPGLDDETGCP